MSNFHPNGRPCRAVVRPCPFGCVPTETDFIKASLSDNAVRARKAGEELTRRAPDRYPQGTPTEWALTLDGHTEESIDVLRESQRLKEYEDRQFGEPEDL